MVTVVVMHAIRVPMSTIQVWSIPMATAATTVAITVHLFQTYCKRIPMAMAWVMFAMFVRGSMIRSMPMQT